MRPRLIYVVPLLALGALSLFLVRRQSNDGFTRLIRINANNRISFAEYAYKSDSDIYSHKLTLHSENRRAEIFAQTFNHNYIRKVDVFGDSSSIILFFCEGDEPRLQSWDWTGKVHNLNSADLEAIKWLLTVHYFSNVAKHRFQTGVSRFDPEDILTNPAKMACKFGESLYPETKHWFPRPYTVTAEVIPLRFYVTKGSNVGEQSEN